MPALIIIGERETRKGSPKLHLHSFGTGKLIEKAIARPNTTIAIWCVFVVICALLATRLRFSDNIQDLRAKGNPGVTTQTRLTEKFGQSFDFMMYVVEGKTIDEVLARKLERRFHRFGSARDQIHLIESLRSIGGERVGERFSGIRGEKARMRVGDSIDLRVHRRQDMRMRVAEARHGGATACVDVAAAIPIDDLDAGCVDRRRRHRA